MTTAPADLKPLLKWVGGKRASASAILDALFDDRDPAAFQGRYIEPFFGSGAIFGALRARGFVGPARLCDWNVRLVQTFLAVRHVPDKVVARLDAFDWSETWKSSYETNRKAFNALPTACLTFAVGALRGGARQPLVEPQEAELYATTAALFLWLNKSCFNGVFRVKLNPGGNPDIPVGGFNVPPGDYKRPLRPTVEDIHAWSAALGKATLWHGDFSEGLALAKAGDRVYCDPPYWPISETANFTSYSGEFDSAAQRRLADAAVEAAKRGARVLLSNHDLPVVREELYPASRGFEHLATLQVRRSVNSKTDKRGSVGEILVAIGPK